jgi:hypothetical protein
MGRGEGACLALAVSKGWVVASDERRRLRRELVERIGAARMVDRASLLRHAISIDCVSVAEADGFEAVLETGVLSCLSQASPTLRNTRRL